MSRQKRTTGAERVDVQRGRLGRRTAQERTDAVLQLLLGKATMDQVLHSAEEVYGSSDSWTQLDLPATVSASGSLVFAVFRLPAVLRSSVGVGGGPGIGYSRTETTDSPPSLISADGLDWVALGSSMDLRVEAVTGQAGLVSSAAGLVGGPGPEQVQADQLRTTLSLAYPNPSASQVRLGFSLAQNEHVEIRIYNARGQLVKQLVDHWLPAGRHQVQWTGMDDRGRRVSHGVYYAVFTAGGTTESKELAIAP